MICFLNFLFILILFLLGEKTLNTNKLHHVGHTCARKEAKNYKDFPYLFTHAPCNGLYHKTCSFSKYHIHTYNSICTCTLEPERSLNNL